MKQAVGRELAPRPEKVVRERQQAECADPDSPSCHIQRMVASGERLVDQGLNRGGKGRTEDEDCAEIEGQSRGASDGGHNHPRHRDEDADPGNQADRFATKQDPDDDYDDRLERDEQGTRASIDGLFAKIDA